VTEKDTTTEHLYIVRVEYEYPVLAGSEAEAVNRADAERAFHDLAAPTMYVDLAGPEYNPPDGYDDECLVYGSQFVTWKQAVEADRALTETCTAEDSEIAEADRVVARIAVGLRKAGL
jgi:hypothetical protein